MANEIKYFFIQNMALMGQVIQAIVILHLLHFHIFYLFNKTKIITLNTKIKLLEINTFFIKKVNDSHGPPLNRHNTERSDHID